jgi:hypothetical protein
MEHADPPADQVAKVVFWTIILFTACFVAGTLILIR